MVAKTVTKLPDTGLSVALDLGAKEANKTRFDFDRTKWLNSSEAGTCIRKIWYSKRAPIKGQKEETWGFARRGHAVEAWATEMLVLANVPLKYGIGEEQQTFQSEELRLSATPDNFIWREWFCAEWEDWTALEIKSFDPRTNIGNLPRPEHVKQLQLGMELADPSGMGNLTVAEGVLLYINASDFDDVHQFEVPRDKTVLNWAAQRAKRALRARQVTTLDREGAKGSGRECRYCVYAGPCGVKQTEAGGSGSVKSRAGSKLDGALRRFMEIKELKGEQDECKEMIKEEMHRRKAKDVTSSGIMAELKTKPGKKSFRRKEAEAELGDLSRFDSVGNPYEELTVSRVE